MKNDFQVCYQPNTQSKCLRFLFRAAAALYPHLFLLSGVYSNLGLLILGILNVNIASMKRLQESLLFPKNLFDPQFSFLDHYLAVFWYKLLA